jgi:adenylate cyclase
LKVAGVRKQLQRILASPNFEASERNRRFLEYIVEETLAGRDDRLKGVTIAIDVFGRDATIDPQQDPVVRVEAAKLRRRLDHYYLVAGQDDPIRIDVPKGGYVPTFEERERAPPDPSRHSTARQDVAVLGNARWPWPPRRGFALAIALGAVLAAVGTAAWLWPSRAPADQGAAQTAAESRQLPGPAIVVAPFEDLTGTDSGRLLGTGLTQEVIAGLTHFADLRVYLASDDGQDLLVGRDRVERPDVRYMVKGDVRRTAGGLRTTVHLIEHGTGRYLWSETDERPLTDGDAVAWQEALGAELAAHLAEPYGVVRQIAAHRGTEYRPEILRTYDCVSQAYAYRRTFNPDVFGSAQDCLEEAVRREPSRPDAWAMLAFSYVDEYYWYGLGSRYRQPELLEQANVAAERAMELDRDTALSLMAYAYVQFARGRLDEAEAAGRRAVVLNPNLPEASVYLGYRIAFTRDWDQGMAMVRLAIERTRAPDGWYYILLAIDDYRRGDCRQALADVVRVGAPFFFLGPALVAMCQAELGNQEAAARALQETLAANPTFAKDPRGIFRMFGLPEDLIDRFMIDLRKAGPDASSAQSRTASGDEGAVSQ